MSPITYGEYPERMTEIVKDRLPTFTKEESQTLKMSYDFVGVNYYTGRFATDISKDPISVVSYNTDMMVKTQGKFIESFHILLLLGSLNHSIL